jgi:glyoxylase-like metal-dependent hydrolase (beta-lactamase superfamily II)
LLKQAAGSGLNAQNRFWLKRQFSVLRTVVFTNRLARIEMGFSCVPRPEKHTVPAVIKSIDHDLAWTASPLQGGFQLNFQRLIDSFRFCVLVSLLLTVTAPQVSVIAGEFDYPVMQVTDKIQVILGPLDLPNENNRGFRNNVVIVSTSKGIVLMDPGGSAWTGDMVAAKVRSMSDAPVLAVFNSHAHGDHWLGNEGIRRNFPDAVIYGHPNMKARLERDAGLFWLETINRVTGNTANGKQVVAPDRTVNNGDVISVGDTDFRILHFGRAHTDNDIMVEVVGENALFTGDVVRDRFIGQMLDDSSFKGSIEAIGKIVAMNYKYYIPGHGSVGDVELPLTYSTYLKTLRGLVKQMFDEGLESYEMKPRIVEALADYRQWTGFELRLGAQISRLYLEIEEEEFE